MPLPFDVDSTWVNSGASYDAGELRRADAASFAGDGTNLGVRGGIVRHGNSSLLVSVDGSDNVTVQAGAVVIPGNAVSGTGCYRAALSTSQTGALAARDATNGRIDRIIFRQLDTDVVGSHGARVARVEVTTGTPSATPGVPSLPSMAVELARVTVPASGGGAASVDLSYRPFASALGGEIVVATEARLPTLAVTGQKAYTLDEGREYRWTGSAWAIVNQSSVVITGNYTTNSSGRFTVTHGLGVEPRYAHAAITNNGGRYCSIPSGGLTPTTVTFEVRQMNQNGNAVIGDTVPVAIQIQV